MTNQSNSFNWSRITLGIAICYVAYWTARQMCTSATLSRCQLCPLLVHNGMTGGSTVAKAAAGWDPKNQIKSGPARAGCLHSLTGPLVPLGWVLTFGTSPALSDASAGRKRLTQVFWPVVLLYTYGETAVLTWGAIGSPENFNQNPAPLHCVTLYRE